ncbi:MAG: hypothetical protein HZB26_11230 [Candidatus Hydrogenedentes bacterium]|nr:hypothetical protein [Candidatus Hydrogenedentota bacterium]
MIWRVANSTKRPVRGIPVIFFDEVEANACVTSLNARSPDQMGEHTYGVFEVSLELVQSLVNRRTDTAKVQELLFPSIPVSSMTRAATNVVPASIPTPVGDGIEAP